MHELHALLAKPPVEHGAQRRSRFVIGERTLRAAPAEADIPIEIEQAENLRSGMVCAQKRRLVKIEQLSARVREIPPVVGQRRQTRLQKEWAGFYGRI